MSFKTIVSGWLAAALLVSAGWTAETETFCLSGKGKDDPVKWDFLCSAGQKANKWSTIGVPSNWELQGFGVYTYGRGGAKVQGRYKRTFTTPPSWTGKKVFIVFEGVMTDTRVSLNGQSAGPMHQGGYYRFKYDITRLLKAGDNLLEVTVDDDSANSSINSAERRGDYWNYAGIYRPVYLEAVPPTSIDRVAIDGKADGSLTADVFINDSVARKDTGESVTWSVEAKVLDLEGKAVGNPMAAKLTLPGSKARVAGKINAPRLWTAETPNLYQLEFSLKNESGAVVHTVRQKFGFRTLEVRAGAGLFLNGSRIMLKGSCRHSFWPDSGRCLSEKISHDDIALMKEMNMNAVRMSHYPPDQHFLDACDEMGLYVLDELAGWQHAYDTPSATRLVGEMVVRDVNHPCILFWDNGNEGGWNSAVDGEFAKWDPQQRHVLHPQQTIRGIDNSHYPQYSAVVSKSAGNNPFFPTEFLHAIYDGGGGAGLHDYWKVMTASKVASGGFIWAFLDEDVVRTDKGGRLDSNGNQAPDGLVGPYREKEGSFYTIREIWSPIIVSPSPNGDFTLENHYAFTDARQCSFNWERRLFKSPAEPGAGYAVTLKGDAAVQGGSVPPGATGKLVLVMPDIQKTSPADALALTAKDPQGHELWTWVWSHDASINRYRALATAGNNGSASPATETPDAFTAAAGGLSLRFDKKTGLLAAASRGGKTFSFHNGPRLLAGDPPAANRRGAAAPATPPALAPSKLTSFTQNVDGRDLVLAAAFDGPMKSITYRLHPNGWLSIDYAYNLTGPHALFGVGFDYPESKVQSMRYLGNGPAPVYQNRLAGGTLDVWDKKYNNTMVGDPDDLAPGEHFDYPVFKGYYAGVRWLQLNTTEGPITALLNQDDLYVQVFTPKMAPDNIRMNASATFANAGISFLHAISPMGNKFGNAATTGPQGQPAVAKGDYKGSISLHFGELPKP
jgi:hypothetical protein